MPHGAQARRIGLPAIALATLALVTASCSRRGSQPTGGPVARGPSQHASGGRAQPGGGAPRMEKYVSEQASFVVYKPKGWSVREESQPGIQGFRVSDPAGSLETAMYFGSSPTGDDVAALAGVFASVAAKGKEDFRIGEVIVSPDRRRVMYDAAFTSAERVDLPRKSGHLKKPAEG